MTETAAGGTALPIAGVHRRTIVALQIVVLLLAGLRLIYDITAAPAADEAYYWMWGQHPDWSYFDHPPLHAWLLGLVSAVLGWHNFSVRALTWLTLLGVALIFRAWAPRLAPDAPRLLFWSSFAIYFASPFYFGMTGIAYHDHLLVFLGLLAIHCFVVFIDRHETGTPGALRWLYAAAIALGLATLTKYNGAVVGFAFALTFLWRPRLRPLLATPHPWLAALLAIAMQAPVIYWNLANHFASFRFHLDDRWGGTGGLHIGWLPLVYFVVLNLVLLSPFLFWPLVRAIRTSPASDFEARLRTPAIALLAISTAAFSLLMVLLGGYFYWNILAYPALFPLIARALGIRVQFWAHLIFGLIIAAVLTANFAVLPITALFGKPDGGTAINYGWDEVASHMRAAEAVQPADLVAATRFSTTSQLGFALATANVVPIAVEPTLEWQFWVDPKALVGKSALILTDESDASSVIANLHARFDNVAVVDDFKIVRFGKSIYRWRIFRGDNYHLDAPR